LMPATVCSGAFGVILTSLSRGDGAMDIMDGIVGAGSVAGRLWSTADRCWPTPPRRPSQGLASRRIGDDHDL
jgi:hypothetical protein